MFIYTNFNHFQVQICKILKIEYICLDPYRCDDLSFRHKALEIHTGFETWFTNNEIYVTELSVLP